MNRLEERVADQLNEKALDVAADVAYTHHELWARTSGSPTDLAIRSIISAYLAALESQGLKIVPVETLRKWYIELDREAHDLADEVAAMLNAVEE